MRGKWAAGIPPRNFTWIIKDRLAVSERPGGYAPTHRRVRRQEEIIWLKVQGFTKVISMIPSSHNLAAYEEREVDSSQYPVSAGSDPRGSLGPLYEDMQASLEGGRQILLHQEELGDRVMGVVGGFLFWSGRIVDGPKAIAFVEALIGHPMGPSGRELVLMADELPGHRGKPAVKATRPTVAAAKKPTSAKKAAPKKAPAKKAPVKKAPAKKAPVKTVPAKKAPVKKAPVKKAPVKKVSGKK